MNKLQKRAWIDLTGMTVCVVAAGIGVAVMVKLNAKGIVPIMSFFVCFLISGLIGGLRNIATHAKLDERERKIVLKAVVYSSFTFTLYYCCASFIIFFVLGGKGVIPSYILPVLFLVGLFLAQFIQSAVILIQSAREEADE